MADSSTTAERGDSNQQPTETNGDTLPPLQLRAADDENENDSTAGRAPRTLTDDQDFATATARRPRRGDNSAQDTPAEPTSGMLLGSSEIPAHMLESVRRLQQRLPTGARIVVRPGRPSFQIIQSTRLATSSQADEDHSESQNSTAGLDDQVSERGSTSPSSPHPGGDLRGRLASAATFRPRIQVSTVASPPYYTYAAMNLSAPPPQRPGLGRGMGFIGGPTRIQFRPVPPLEPSVLIDDQQCFRRQLDEIGKQVELERFVCAICFEIMDQPATCGRCPSRFCRACLARVWTGLSSGGSEDNSIPMQRNQPDPQCPTCRQPLHVVQADMELKNELEKQDPIPCRYDQCNEVLRLTDIKHHEAVACAQVRVACRYRSLGCKWVGPRGVLPDHEEFDCPFTKISLLVEGHRTTREHFQQGFRQLEDRVGALGAVLDHHLDFSRRQDEKSLSNPIDLLTFLVAATCSTPQYLTAKASWSWFFSSDVKRGTVFNFALMIPTCVVFARVATKEFHRGFAAIDVALNETPSETPTANILGVPEAAFDSLLTCLTVTLLGTFLVLCCYFDDSSSVIWKCYQIRPLGESPIMMYNTAVALFLFYFIAAHSCGSIFSACMQWLLLASSSFLLPSVVAVVSIASGGETGSHDIKMTGRMTLPLLFGLRHSLLVAMCGMLPSLDAISIAYLLWTRIEFLRRVVKNRDIVFSNIPDGIYLAFVFARLAMKTGDFYSNRPLEWVDTAVAAVLFLLIHESTTRIATISARLGAWTTDLAVREQRRPASVRRSFVGVGMAVFGSWFFMLMMLAVT